MDATQKIPVLMPFQELAFNGDFFVSNEFINLKDIYKIKNAIETGTCIGSTTMFLSEVFENVYSIEVNAEFLAIAKQRLHDKKNICLFWGKSENVLPQILSSEEITDKTICFCDAHWGPHCPLLDELSAIAKAGIKPVIAIHDFFVPGEPALGYDSINGQRFDLEWIRPKLEAIYGINNFSYHYNSNEFSTAIKRGIIFIYPKQ